MTLDEAGGDKDEEPDGEQAEKTSRSAKRRHDGDTGVFISQYTVKFTYTAMFVFNPRENIFIELIVTEDILSCERAQV